MGKGSAQAGALRYLIEARPTTGTIQLHTNNGSWHSAVSGSGLMFDAWTQVAITWNGVETLTFYHNGQNAGSVAFSASWFASTTDLLQLGAAHASQLNSNLYYFGGCLDEVALFDQALSASTISDLYDRGTGVFRLP